jgi:hypothetical protein
MYEASRMRPQGILYHLAAHQGIHVTLVNRNYLILILILGERTRDTLHQYTQEGCMIKRRGFLEAIKYLSWKCTWLSSLHKRDLVKW